MRRPVTGTTDVFKNWILFLGFSLQVSLMRLIESSFYSSANARYVHFLIYISNVRCNYIITNIWNNFIFVYYFVKKEINFKLKLYLKINQQVFRCLLFEECNINFLINDFYCQNLP
jgi:hypothetical protein